MLERPSGRGDLGALTRLLGGPDSSWLVARVRMRMPDAGDETLSGVVRLRDPSDEQRAAAMRMLGRPKRAGGALTVDLALVEQVLRRGPWPAGLADAVETLSGPVPDRRAEREREAAAWTEARAALAPILSRFPDLVSWWDDWCGGGGLKRAARSEAARLGIHSSPDVGMDLVNGLVAVFSELPASGEPLAVLARRALGDSHGLDASRPLGRLAVIAVRLAFEAEPERAPSSSRDAWAAAGIVLSRLSSTVLSLGVPGALAISDAGDVLHSATARALEAMRVARAPMLLTLDQVRSGGVRPLPRRSTVHVCENPTVVEVVAERWARSSETRGEDEEVPGPVVVCTSGQPSTAVLELLTRLVRDGAECRYHGDFDWAGLRIARFLSTSVDWVPWRFSAEDYVEAVREGRPSLRLTGSSAESPWDPRLAIAMAEHGLAVEEEAVADLLSDDVMAWVE